MSELATVCFIRNRKLPDNYYLRIDNEPNEIVERLNNQFEYDVELALTFPIDEKVAESVGYRSAKDAADWFIAYLTEYVAIGKTPEPFLRDWFIFSSLELSDVQAAFDSFLTEKRQNLEITKELELIGRQEDLFI